MRIPIAILVLAALAGCATPEQACIRDATRELRVLDTLIGETRANLARGYAVQSESEPTLRLVLCSKPDDHFTFCTEPGLRSIRKPVAIDPETEQRKLTALMRKRQELQRALPARLRACRQEAAGG